MSSYQPRYTNRNTGLDTLDTAFPSMKSAQARAWDLVNNGMAEPASITFRTTHGETLTIADIEKILADNEVPYVPIV